MRSEEGRRIDHNRIGANCPVENLTPSPGEGVQQSQHQLRRCTEPVVDSDSCVDGCREGSLLGPLA